MAADPGLFAKIMNMAESVPGRAAATGLATSGLSVLGNVLNGKLDDKEPGRILAEALGAGILGAGSGAANAAINNKYKNLAALGEVPTPTKLQMGLNHAGSLGGAVAAGGLGGLIGGGLSNAAVASDISGFGSSNTANAKNSMQMAGVSAQPLPTMSPEEAQYLAYLESTQMMPM